MTKSIASSLILLISIVFAQTVSAEVTKKYDFSGYDQIEVNFPFTVEIIQANKHKAIIEIDDRLADYLDVKKIGSTLSIDMNSHQIKSNCCQGVQTMRAKIYLPSLKKLKLNTAVQASLTGFGYMDSFELALTGASQVEGDLEAGQAKFELSGASHVAFKGAVKKLDLEVSGASHAELSNFAIKDIQANIGGASKAQVAVSGKLNADVSGVSKLYYSGNPNIDNLESSGLSTIVRQ